MFRNPKRDFSRDFDRTEIIGDGPITEDKLMRKFKTLKCLEAEESFVQILLQILFPYLIAGLGMVAAGSVLNHVKQWEVFQHISEVVILIPALLGLKGNLEMTLGARLSTQANLGTMDTFKGFCELVYGNIALSLCQALVVGFLASMLAIAFSIPQKEEYIEISHALLLTSSCMSTAFLSSVVLGLIMCGVVYLSRMFHINPDYIAIPVAGGLGDLIAISMLAVTSQFFYRYIGTLVCSCPIIIMLLSIPLWWHISSTTEYSKEALQSGWGPIIGAMTISTLGGVILDNTITHYKGLARFQPMINGIGGNLVAIQVSRLSTSLHMIGPLGTDLTRIFKNHESWKGSFSLGSKSAQVLLALVIPGHMVFVSLVWLFHSNDVAFLQQTRNLSFLFFYSMAAFLQVAILLHMAHGLVVWQWNLGLDPDTTAIPYLTSIGDLLGIILLALAFYLHNFFNPHLGAAT